MGPWSFITALHVLFATARVSSNTSKTGIAGFFNVSAEEPDFFEPIENQTVPSGRTVRLGCSVKNLGNFKVAWMHYEQSAILTVHNHVITRNSRITVSHDKHDKYKTWYLQISDVKPDDQGKYMCQINTIHAKTQYGYLNVVVAPIINDALSSSDTIVREGANLTLRCKCSIGSPTPTIKWKKDDNTNMTINKTLTVKEWSGEILEITKISRLDMGIYLCIASNGVPPAVSKRITVSVDFPPMLWIPHQLVGVPENSNVTLECFTEAHPTSLNYWTKYDGQMIHDSKKYSSDTSVGVPIYKTHMKLTIFRITMADYGMYKCVAKNPRGDTDGTIRLYASTQPSTIIPTSQPTTDLSNDILIDDDLSNEINTIIDNKSFKYQSHLNEIDKSEQKSTIENTKNHLHNLNNNWLSGDTGCQLTFHQYLLLANFILMSFLHKYI